MQVSYQTPPRTLLEVFKMLPEGTRAELIDNSLYMLPAPTLSHQDVSVTLASLIFMHVRQKKSGKVYAAPVDVFLSNKNAFQPDIIFISTENKSKLKKDGIYGAPDLIIEILSPGSKKLDLTKKKDAYEKAGVKEYWIVEPLTKETIGYQLNMGTYALLKKETGKLSSAILNHIFKF
jgi:Uma2 family endonuclease